MSEDKILKRKEALQAILEKCLKTEPRLSYKDIAEVICWEIGDISNLIREVKKESKRS